MAHLNNLSQLEAAGGFVSHEPLKRQVTWTRVNDDGVEVSDTFDIYVLDKGLDDVLDSDEVPPGKKAVTWQLCKSLMMANDKGVPTLISYERAAKFKPALAAEILKVVKEAIEPKNLQPLTSSSATSSPVESAATP